MIKIVILTLAVLFFSGCSVKEYKLFQQENSEHRIETQELNISYRSKIIPNDILEIDIYNMNKKSNIMLPDKGGVSVIPNNKYIVYADGTIILPLLKSVHVAGYTIKELNQFLTDEYHHYLKSPYIKSTIKNHKIYVLGEVRKEGLVPMEGETISIIEVIAKAGGLTDHAVRNRIRVISENNGKHILTTLDLNRFNTLDSRNLMLKNNTIVYVEPKSAKAVNVAINDYLPIVKAVSSILSTFLTIEILNNK